MSEASDAYLDKAVESLAGAESEFANGRYNNAANRAYYACFQAAITALMRASIRPAAADGEWGHAFVQRQFVGLLIQRRKLYSSDLKDTLAHVLIVRERADYRPQGVSQLQALRSLARARVMVSTIVTREAGPA